MTALIGLDWGSSNVRAFRFDDEGQVVEHHAAPYGAATLPPDGYEAVLAELVGGWTDGHVPIVIAGMAGSRGGWREATYLPCPADPSSIAAGGVSIDTRLGRCLILPGLSFRDAEGVGNVMRGEETQLLGLGLAEGLVVMPGTHCKWTRLTDGRVIGFRTFMTGELYALLIRQSLIGRLAPADARDDAEAFNRGVDRALGAKGATPLLFSARAEALLGTLEPTQISSYLGGVLIGGEIAHALGEDRTVTLVGAESLCARYAAALARAGADDVALVDGDEAVARGLWTIGRSLA